MIFVMPGQTFEAAAIGLIPGLSAGTVGVTVKDKPTGGAIITARTTAGITEEPTGSGIYGKSNFVAPSTGGTYWLHWDSGLNTPPYAIEPFEVALVPTYAASAVLVTRDEVRTALNIPSDDTAPNTSIDQAVAYASAAVRQYCNRSFEITSGVASARSFLYHESGIITIDDFQHGSITSVSVEGTALTTGAWNAEPRATEYPVGYWIEALPGYNWSPEMGFMRNEDVLYAEGRLLSRLRSITVTANWGWTSIPGDVKQAALWTAIAFRDNPRPYISESIAGYSRTSMNPMNSAIPERAQSLLDHHVKQ